MFSVTTELTSCPKCKCVFNDQQGPIKVEGHSAWVDMNGNVVEALSDDTTLIISDSKPEVTCECGEDLSAHFTSTEE